MSTTCDPCEEKGLKCASGACDCPCHGDVARDAGRPMRIVVTGSRHARLAHCDVITHHLRGFPRRTIVAHGAADGVDCLAGHAAAYHGYRVERWPVDWNAARRILGDRWRLAGPLRNGWMLHAAPTDLVLALPMPGSKGTRDMIRQATAAGVPVRVVWLAS